MDSILQFEQAEEARNLSNTCNFEVIEYSQNLQESNNQIKQENLQVSNQNGMEMGGQKHYEEVTQQDQDLSQSRENPFNKQTEAQYQINDSKESQLIQQENIETNNKFKEAIQSDRVLNELENKSNDCQNNQEMQINNLLKSNQIGQEITQSQEKQIKYERLQSQGQDFQENLEESKFQENSLIQRKILFVGLVGVGKTRLYNQFNSKHDSENAFKEVSLQLGEIEYTFVDSPSFEMDSPIEGIERREKTINLFQTYFLANLNSISTVAIIVNFERTDLMRRKIMEVNKYIKTVFQGQIIIVVTDWEKSESENDRGHLDERFQQFGYKIVFTRSDFNREELLREFDEKTKHFKTINLDFQNSVFELSNQKEQEKMNERLNEQFNNKFKSSEPKKSTSVCFDVFGMRRAIKRIEQSLITQKLKYWSNH